MNLKNAKSVVASLGYSLSKTEYGEYRLVVRGGSEAGAFYTNDLDDAVSTAVQEHRRALHIARAKATREAMEWNRLAIAVGEG